MSLSTLYVLYYERVPPFQSWFVIQVSDEWTLTLANNNMNEPYASPATNPDSGAVTSFDFSEAEKKRKVWKLVIWISLAGVIIPILVAIIGFVIGMSRAMNHLAEGDGSADPSELAGDISTSLLSGTYGSLISVVALIVLIIAMVKFFGIRRSIRKHGSSSKNSG